MMQPVPSCVFICRYARMANHSGLIRFICTAKAWNSTLRSYSSSLAGAPWMRRDRAGHGIDRRRRDGAAGIVDQDVDASIDVCHSCDEGVDGPVIGWSHTI